MATEYQNMKALTIAASRNMPSILTCAIAASGDENVRDFGSIGVTPNVELTGAARLYRAASSD